MKDIKVFDFMIKRNLRKYTCDPWMNDLAQKHYASVPQSTGQVNYKGEIFVVVHNDGYTGTGNMGDEGSPPSATIIRVKK